MRSWTGWLARFARDDRGRDLIEYALLVALAVLALLGGLHTGPTPAVSPNSATVAGS